jgi:hypothetical protein
MVGDILEAWSAPSSGRNVQLIERIGAEWTLAEPHALARDFIIEGGNRERDGAKGGRIAKEKKKSKAAQSR